ncbi:MAG: PQQ-dependent sugar dehydrogenase [Pseudomonadota bacterium]
MNTYTRLFGALASLMLLAGTPAALATDTDGDGEVDIEDNCIDVANPNQRDTDGDLYGNLCDADLNNDQVVNVVDLGLFRSRFFSDDADADFNGDGVVNVLDLGIMRQQFFAAPGPSGAAIADTDLQYTRVGTVSFNNGLSLRQTDGDPSRWYVLERAGRFISFDTNGSASSLKTVMTVPNVDTTFEGGALSFDFHPDFSSNGYVYVYYTAGSSIASLESRISRFTTSVDASDGLITADASSEVIVYRTNQPFSNHNGGDLHFGPDGFLYLSLGDGGSGGDPQNHGQRRETPLGAMLRIDVDVSATDFDNGVRYYIPATNPFASSSSCSTGLCPEIFAYGLRNPYRFNFDSENGDIWLGDVGQNAREEISLIVNGGNFGWRCREGELPFNSSGCGPASDYIEPVYTYPTGASRSVVGGVVYRGNLMPELDGMYFFSDVFSGRLWGIYRGDYAGQFFDSSLNIGSFAEGLDGEIYITSFSGLYRLEQSP